MNSDFLNALFKNVSDRYLDLLTFSQEFIELEATHHVTECRLSILRSCESIVLHFHYRSARIHHLEKERSVDLDRNVVFGDSFLGRNF